VKNVNRFRRRMRKAGVSIPPIIPATFVLPQVSCTFVSGVHTLHPATCTRPAAKHTWTNSRLQRGQCNCHI
jgi:hypothetical protein